MASSLAGRALGLFLYLLILDGTAILFFTRGFLLTRTELSDSSSCSDIAQCPCRLDRSSPLSVGLANAGEAGDSSMLESGPGNEEMHERRGKDDPPPCWRKPLVDRVVILVIDALRFDFVAHSRNFEGDPMPWMDKLPVLQQKLEEDNSSARLFKFIADPPTTTLQRLKGLTTGDLPTFIDIGHSFGAPAILEDNLISQLLKTKKKVIMMGDDTWMQLFPSPLLEAYPFPSFNVKDLHTVDDGVIRELFPALHRDDWDVLIAHFLGVDHVGHIFGVESHFMPEKLQQYNKVIEDVVALLTNMSQPGGSFENALLLVMGDHGQTLNGDHGGGTPEEVESGLFAWGTRRISSSHILDFFPPSCNLDDSLNGCIRTFSQLDFSATLAAILGVPFPFGSLGQVNGELFKLVARNSAQLMEESNEKDEVLLSSLGLLESFNEVLCINSWQVRRYFASYAEAAMTGFPAQDLMHLEDLHSRAENASDQNKLLHRLMRPAEDTEATEAVIVRAITATMAKIDAYKNYLSAAASLARSQWTQFRLESMVAGFVLLLATIAVRGLAIRNLCDRGTTCLEKLFPLNAILFSSLSALYLTAMVFVLHPILAKTSLPKTFDPVHGNLGVIFLGATVSASLVAYFFAQGFSVTKSDSRQLQRDQIGGRAKQMRGKNIEIVGAFLFVFLHGISLFSNSYIVAEGVVIHFMIASAGVLYLRSAIQAEQKLPKAVSFLALAWLLPRIQKLAVFKGVIAGDNDTTGNGSRLQILLTFATIIVPLGVLSWFLYQNVKRGTLQRVFALVTAIGQLLIGIHWLMADLASGELVSIPGALIEFSRLWLPRLIYVMTAVLTLGAGVLGQVGSKEKDDFVANYRDRVLGVCRALLAGVSSTIILLMGRKGPLITLLAALEIEVFFELQSMTTSLQKDELARAGNLCVEDAKPVSSFGAAANWGLIAGQLFFCTGHSCAFDGLHYSAAFIGFDDFGFYQQGILLGMETFGAAYVLPVIGLPLLVVEVHDPLPVGLELYAKEWVIQEIVKGYLWFGLLKAFMVLVTTASVSIQRRHLMVWGIFAPKYVFDAVGYLILDILVMLAALTFFGIHGSRLRKA